MPRKEGPPLEERIQRAKELFEFKRQQKEKNLQILYASRIYKLARKTSITFLWITQLLLIDWALPYMEEKDRISGGYFNSNTMPNKGIGGITDYKLTELFIKTDKGYHFKVDFPDNTREPSIGDSVVIYKSLLFRDFKKLGVPRIKESYFITSSVTYRFFPFLLIISALAIMFIFVKNIEVKSFAWLAFIFTAIGSIFFICYLVVTFQ